VGEYRSRELIKSFYLTKVWAEALVGERLQHLQITKYKQIKEALLQALQSRQISNPPK
jgi:hypothetical protein